MLTEQNLKAAYQHFNDAFESQKKGDNLTAIQYYRLSIDNFPTIEAYLNLASVLSKVGRYKEAINECYFALRIDRKEYSAYNYIGFYLVKMKKYHEAKIWLDVALTFKNNSNRHLTYFNLGIVFEKKGDWYQAINMFDKALMIKPKFSKARKNIMLLSARLN